MERHDSIFSVADIAFLQQPLLIMRWHLVFRASGQLLMTSINWSLRLLLLLLEMIIFLVQLYSAPAVRWCFLSGSRPIYRRVGTLVALELVLVLLLWAL